MIDISSAKSRLINAVELYKKTLLETDNLNRHAKAAKEMFKRGKAALNARAITEQDLQKIQQICLQISHERMRKMEGVTQAVREFFCAKLQYPYERCQFRTKHRKTFRIKVEADK